MIRLIVHGSNRLHQLAKKSFSYRHFSIKYFRIPMPRNADALKILYEDDHIVAVDKVFNMLSVPGKSEIPLESVGNEEEEDTDIPVPTIDAPYVPRYLEWKRVAQHAHDHSTVLDETGKRILARLLECESFPRRKNKFFLFLDTVTKKLNLFRSPLPVIDESSSSTSSSSPLQLSTPSSETNPSYDQGSVEDAKRRRVEKAGVNLDPATHAKKMQVYEALWNELSRIDFDLHKRPVVANRDPGECSVSELLETRYGQRVFHLHRLDQETSGVLLFARTEAAASHVCRQFRERTVQKVYRALVAGTVDPLLRRIELSIRADLDNRPMQVVDPVNGKESVTLITDSVPSDGPIATSLVTLKPLTGRTHQLRLHLSSVGHPILGDTLYAPKPVLQMSPRLCLHAYSISFTHPIRGHVMEIKSDCDWMDTSSQDQGQNST